MVGKLGLGAGSPGLHPGHCLADVTGSMPPLYLLRTQRGEPRWAMTWSLTLEQGLRVQGRLCLQKRRLMGWANDGHHKILKESSKAAGFYLICGKDRLALYVVCRSMY